MRVGIIGVGTMGSRMLEKMLEASHTVFARDINPAVEKKAAAIGAEIVKTPKEVAEQADISLLSLPLPSDIKEVVRGKDGILRGAKPGHVIVDLSTVDSYTTQDNAEASSKLGIGYIDAPVLGRPQNIGKWALPLGGEEQYIPKITPILQLFAKKLIYVGPSGHGDIIKVLNNLMFGTINSITAEIMSLSAKLGMKPEILFKTIAESGAASVSNLFIELGPKMLERDYSPLFALELLKKDVSLGIKMAKEMKVPVYVTEVNQKINEMACSKGLGKEDSSAVVKLYEEIYGIEVKR